MANLATYKEVTLDGERQLLKFDYNSTCDLEDIYNKGIAAILHEEQIGFRLVRAFYWAGLKWKMHGLTIDKVGYLLGKEIQENGKSITDLMEPVMDALKKSKLLGDPKNEKAIDAEYEELPEGDESKN